jgi:hypothetical protein
VDISLTTIRMVAGDAAWSVQPPFEKKGGVAGAGARGRLLKGHAAINPGGRPVSDITQLREKYRHRIT